MGFYSVLCLSLFIVVSNVTCSEISRDVVTEVPPEDIPEDPGGLDMAEVLETTLTPLSFENLKNTENYTLVTEVPAEDIPEDPGGFNSTEVLEITLAPLSFENLKNTDNYTLVTEVPPEDIPEDPGGLDTTEVLETTLTPLPFENLKNIENYTLVTEVPPEDIPEDPGGLDTMEVLQTTLTPLPFENLKNTENYTLSASESIVYVDFDNIGNVSLQKSEYITYNPELNNNIEYKTQNITIDGKEIKIVPRTIDKLENSTEIILKDLKNSVNEQILDKQKDIQPKKPADILDEMFREGVRDDICGYASITWLLTEVNKTGNHFPGDCWNHMCKKTFPSPMNQKFDGNKIIWFYQESFECYDALIVGNRNTSLFYKIVDVAKGVKLFFIHPRCPQMMGSVNVFLSLHFSPWGLPISCQEDICIGGADELMFPNVNVNLVTQMKSNDHAQRNKCLNDLYQKLGDSDDTYGMNTSMKCRDITQKSINNYEQNVKYCYSENYPETSPCKTVYAVRKDSNHYQVIIPIRSGECSSLDENQWFDLLHSYFSSLHNNIIDKNLHLCLLRKGQGMQYNNNKYVHLLNDMLGHKLVLPNISQSCVTYLCDPAIHISSSNRLSELSQCMPLRNYTHLFKTSTCNKNTTWFTYINECSDGCDRLQKMSDVCYESIGNRHYSLVNSSGDNSKSSFLTPILKSSCPGGSGAGELGRQRAEVLDVLWKIGDNITQACMPLVCKAAIKLLDDHYTDSVYLPLNFNPTLVEVCLKQLTTNNVYEDNYNKIFSFGDRISSRKVVFVMSNDKSKVEFLSLAFSHGHLDLIACCNEPLDITSSIHTWDFHTAFCFTTKYTNQDTPDCRPHNNSIWYKEVEMTSNVVLLLIDKGDKVNYLLQWLATFSVSLSKPSIEFIQSTSYGMHDFRSAKIFTLKEGDRSLEVKKLIESLKNAYFTCTTESDQFDICDTTNWVSSKEDNIIYLIIFRNCEIDIFDTSKILLLFMSQKRGKTGVNTTALCHEDNVVASVTLKSKSVLYTTSGHQTSKTLQALQKAAPRFSWQADFVNLLNKEVEDRECFPLKHLTMLPRVLDRGECVIYNGNNSTYIMNPALENEDYTFRFTVDIHKVKSNKYETDIRTFYQKASQQAFDLLEQVRLQQLGNSSDFDETAIYNFTLQRILPYPPQRMFYLHMKIPVNVTTEIYNHSFQDLVYKSLNRIPLESHSLQIIKDTLNPETSELNIKANLNVILNSYIKNDSDCVGLLSNKSFVVNHLGKQLILVGPISNDLVQNTCFDSLPDDLWDDLNKLQKKNKTTINKFWPGCLHNMIISTSLNVTVIDWWYLDSVCKMFQVILLLLSTAVTFVIIAGNIFVLLFIWKSGKWREGHIMVRASLALADLLVGLLPAILAVWDHASLMNGSLTLQHLAPDTILESFQNLRKLQAPGFRQLRFEREGYPMFCSMVLSTSVFVSILTLALLSIERLCAMTRKVLKNRYVVFGVSASWILGIILTILVNCREGGWIFRGYFDPVTKITTSIGSGGSSVSQVVFYLMVTIVSLASLTIIVFTTSTIILLHADFCYSNRYLPGIRDRDVKQTTLTSLYMVGLFILSCIPAALDFGLNLDSTSPFMHFVCWWLFIAGSSWNWTLYTLRGDLRNYGQILCSTARNRVRSSLEITNERNRVRNSSEETNESYVPSEHDANIYISGPTKITENGNRVEVIDLNTTNISATVTGQ